MAISLPTKNVDVTPQKRTRLIEIDSAYGTVPALRAHRELIEVANGEVVRRLNISEVSRSLNQVSDQAHTCADGTVIKVSHLAECLPAWIDAWSIEDEA